MLVQSVINLQECSPVLPDLPLFEDSETWISMSQFLLLLCFFKIYFY